MLTSSNGHFPSCENLFFLLLLYLKAPFLIYFFLLVAALMPQSYLPLRWESTGDHWWYASPIDFAAANGHYDLVRELLHLDTNLLIRLTSLRRLRRLETVWDDDARFLDAARGRSFVARCLLLECEAKNGSNTLIRAGYGGWLLYTAASAGDAAFVRELLERDPLLVFGEGEYGVTDILYAAARGKNPEVFRILFKHAVRPACLAKGGGGGGGARGEIEEEGETTSTARGGNLEVFRWEMVNRAAHAAARGGSLELLREMLSGEGSSDVLAYRDVQGSTLLHAASGKGQVEVVKYLVSSFNIIDSRDNHGNIALHIAAFRGQLSIVEVLIFACPASSSMKNNAGDTFLHMAVAGFRTPGFRRLDGQMELMKRIIGGSIVNIQEIINIRNYEGRTALHLAVIGNMHSDLVELLMTARSIDLNIRDINGMTTLDLLSQRPRSASSEILIKQLVSAGGIFSERDHALTSAIASQVRMQGIGSSPGTSFKVSDAEIFLYAGIEVAEASGRPSTCSSSAKSEAIHHGEVPSDRKKQSSVNRAANKLKLLLKWPLRKGRKSDTAPKKAGNDYSMDSVKTWSEREDTPTPLRQRFSKTSLLNSKRTLSVRSSMPSPAAKKKFTAGLMHGVIQAMPHLAPQPAQTPSDTLSRSGMSTPTLEKQKEMLCMEEMESAPSCSNLSVKSSCERPGHTNSKLMNQYFCFGAQGLAVEDSVSGQRSSRLFKRSVLSVA